MGGAPGWRGNLRNRNRNHNFEIFIERATRLNKFYVSRVHARLFSRLPPESPPIDITSFASQPRPRSLIAYMFSGQLLSFALHIPATCTTFPLAAREQLLLRNVGFRAIIADEGMHVADEGCLPILYGGTVDDLVVDSTHWIWLRGSRETLITRASQLPAFTKYIASMPVGSSMSESALRSSCILAWQLRSSLRCSGLVVSWPELEIAADSVGGDWDKVCTHLDRMRRPEWTPIHGG